MMTAKTVARDRMLGNDHTPVTRLNIKKVTQFRGKEDFEAMVQKFISLHAEKEGGQAALEEDTPAEKESARLADKTQQKASRMAAGIVPESVKQAAKKTQNQTSSQ